MLLNQHVKTEVTQVRGIDSNIQRRLGSEERKAGVFRGMSKHLCVLWQSELRTTVPRIDEAVPWKRLWTSKWVKCSNQVTLGLHHWQRKNPTWTHGQKSQGSEVELHVPPAAWSPIFLDSLGHVSLPGTETNTESPVQPCSSRTQQLDSKLLIYLLSMGHSLKSCSAIMCSALLLRSPDL